MQSFDFLPVDLSLYRLVKIKINHGNMTCSEIRGIQLSAFVPRMYNFIIDRYQKTFGFAKCVFNYVCMYVKEPLVTLCSLSLAGPNYDEEMPMYGSLSKVLF